MPGDPHRAKYIAENFLEDARLVNSVRGMFAYTGNYLGKEITVMAHGIGIPSIGLYTYELFNEYDVDKIIRIGSCGACVPELDLFDIILSEEAFSESNYALTLNNEDCHLVSSNKELNTSLEITANKTGVKLIKGNTITSDCFSPYMTDDTKFFERVPSDFYPISIEMEAFALFYNAKLLGKKAACILSVVDSPYKQEVVSSQKREIGLNNMIKLALEAEAKN